MKQKASNNFIFIHIKIQTKKSTKIHLQIYNFMFFAEPKKNLFLGVFYSNVSTHFSKELSIRYKLQFPKVN